MSDSDGLRFCDLCKRFRDLDRIVSPEQLIHHKSWTELCISAKEGRQLCQAFVRGQAQKRFAIQGDFDKEKEYPATQLTWFSNTASGSGPYILRQPALFFIPTAML
jgi:hypothetical protein